jgi:hypothetical protein
MVAAGRGAQNVIFRAVRLDGERDGPALDDLFVKKLQGGPWFQSDFFQDGFGLAFQFGVNPAFGDGTHKRKMAQMWAGVHQADGKMTSKNPRHG